jgi:uncharacterized membrane protein
LNNTGPPPDSLPSRPRWTLVLLLYPFVLYGLLASGQPVAEWIGLFSLGVLILFPGLRSGQALAWLVLALIGMVAGYATATGQRALVNYLPQILIGLFLMVVFGRTLRPGSVPLITRIAAAMRKGASEVPIRYTRGVTILWVAMFVLLVLEGVLLALFAPHFSFGRVSAVTYAMIIIVMVGEYSFHTWRYPNPAQRGFLDFARQLIQIDYRRLLND